MLNHQIPIAILVDLAASGVVNLLPASKSGTPTRQIRFSDDFSLKLQEVYLLNQFLTPQVSLVQVAMLEIFPFSFEINPTAIAGAGLWSLALYLGFASLSEWIIEQLNRWFNFAERSLYTSAEEFERTRPAREMQNAFYASAFSVVPFLVIGGLCNYGVELGLGQSWSISMGMLACIGCGVYELGRRDGRDSGD